MLQWEISVGNNYFSFKLDGVGAAFYVGASMDRVEFTRYVATILEDVARKVAEGSVSGVEIVNHVLSYDNVRLAHVQSVVVEQVGIDVLTGLQIGPYAIKDDPND